MTTRTKILALAFLCPWLWLAGALAGSDRIKIEGPDLYQLDSHTHDRENVSVAVRVSTGTVSTLYSRYLGTGLGQPSTLVTDIRVEIAGRQVFVPLSVYADLSAPTEAFLQNTAKSTRLVLVGGDASEAYKIVINIGKRSVSSREVYSLIAPSIPVQKTVYSPIELKDE